MMMNFLHSSKKETIAIINISDFAVFGGIINICREGTPEVIYFQKRELPFQEHFSGKRLFYAISRAVFSVASAIQSSGVGRPSRILCVLGPHLHISETRVIKAKYEKPVMVRKELIDDLVAKDLDIFYSKSIGHDLALPSGQNSILEKNNMQIKINGYESADPFGKMASDIEISVFVSMITNGVLSDIRRMISGIFHTNEIYFSSFSFSIFNAVRDRLEKDAGFNIVEVCSEMTNIGIVRDGIIDETFSVPIGVHSLLRKIIHKFRTMHGEALFYIRTHNEKSSDPKTFDNIKTQISEMKKEWNASVYRVFERVSSRRLLPSKFYLACDKDFYPIFSSYLEDMGLSNMLMQNVKKEIRPVGADLFNGSCDNKCGQILDSAMIIDSIFANKVF